MKFNQLTPEEPEVYRENNEHQKALMKNNIWIIVNYPEYKKVVDYKLVLRENAGKNILLLSIPVRDFIFHFFEISMEKLNIRAHRVADSGTLYYIEEGVRRLGTHGLGTVRNDNGKCLVDFCARQFTRRSNAESNHIIINKLFVGCLLDVKTRRGAKIFSDHQLLVGIFKLRPAAHNKERLQSNMEYHWQGIAQICMDSAKSVLADHDVNRLSPVDESNTKDEKLAPKADYRAADRRENFYDNISNNIEKASNTGNLRDVYNNIRYLNGRQSRTTAKIKDDNDHITIDQQLNRWQRNARYGIYSLYDPQKFEERKSAGADNIPAELLMYGAVPTAQSLTPVIRREGVVITIHKKATYKDRPDIEPLLRKEKAGFRTNQPTFPNNLWRKTGLYYADDLCLLTHRFSDIEDKLQKLTVKAAAVGYRGRRIHRINKTRVAFNSLYKQKRSVQASYSAKKKLQLEASENLWADLKS
ncbi:hypothetical protein CVS40_3380 [Lucilia cuprina]|nr:hypothetical protein CVS40_3380 [Lucilia cuprina]